MAIIRGLAHLTERELLALTKSGEFSVEELIAEADGKTQEAWRTSGGTALVPRYSIDWKNLTTRLNINITAPEVSRPKYVFSKGLRDYQVKPVNEAIKRIRALGGLMLQADCGTGKTVMALAISSHIADNVIILVDQIDIAEQWRDQIAFFLPGATTVIHGGGYEELVKNAPANFRIVVAQSLWRKPWTDEPMECGLLIVDEAHVFSTPRFFDSIANISFRHSLALTATPDRKDGLEWIFQKCLGTHTLKVAGKAMTCKVIQVFSDKFAPHVSQKDYGMAWCKSIQGMTWAAKCRTCDSFDNFPACGALPRENPMYGNPSQVKWNDKKMSTTNLFMDACMQPDYLEWLHRQILTLKAKGRNIMVFAAYRNVLQALYDMGVTSMGTDTCGWFVGKAGKKKDTARSAELDKQVTYATYGVADKALDIPKKDCGVFATPKSDIRQTKGRLERVVEGKLQPLILDPVHKNIPMLYGMAMKRRQLYIASECPIVSKQL